MQFKVKLIAYKTMMGPVILYVCQTWKMMNNKKITLEIREKKNIEENIRGRK